MRDEAPFDPTDWTWDNQKGMYHKPCKYTVVGKWIDGKIDILQRGFFLTADEFEVRKRNMTAMEKNNVRKFIR